MGGGQAKIKPNAFPKKSMASNSRKPKGGLTYLNREARVGLWLGRVCVKDFPTWR